MRGGGGVRIKEEWGWRQRGGAPENKKGEWTKGGWLIINIGDTIIKEGERGHILEIWG